jgi:hypothetical protein
VLRAPTENFGCKAGVGDQRWRIARPPRRSLRRDLPAASAAAITSRTERPLPVPRLTAMLAPVDFDRRDNAALIMDAAALAGCPTADR